jgi:hypothetical protein
MHDGRDFGFRSASLAEVEQIGFGATVLVSAMCQTKQARQIVLKGNYRLSW